MSGTGREIPTGLNEFQVVRLFKCAVKDDDTLVDAIIEKLYGTMKDFDAGRAKQTVELIVDRETTAPGVGRLVHAERRGRDHCKVPRSRRNA